jgi:hypothetical protein
MGVWLKGDSREKGFKVHGEISRYKVKSALHTSLHKTKKHIIEPFFNPEA